MTDFNNFNPADKRLHSSNFNPNRQGKGQGADPAARASDAAAAADPYADRKMAADDVFNLMNAQAQWTKLSNVDNSSIYNSIASFESMMSPEAHAKMMGDVTDTFKEEFGFAPSAEFAEKVIADHLTGTPSVQQ